jgi:RNA polymerase sigma factor (sigma-70 family)
MEQTRQNFDQVIGSIQSGDTQAVVDLYVLLNGFRKRLIRQLGASDGEEGFHSGFVALLELIQKRSVNEPGKLVAIADTVFHRQYCQAIRARVRERERNVPLSESIPVTASHRNGFDHILYEQQVRLTSEAMAQLPEKWRELMVRFYLREQSKEEICEAMNLSETQFRLNKSRAKARLMEAVSKRCAKVENSMIELQATA